MNAAPRVDPAQLADLADLAERVFSETARATGDGHHDPGVWAALEDCGLSLVGVPEDAGGSGGSLCEAAVVLRAAARHAAEVPLGETSWLAGWLLTAAGRQVPSGPLTAAALPVGDTAVTLHDRGGRVVVDGRLDRVPWARSAQAIVMLLDGQPARLLVLAGSEVRVETGRNLAGEPRDTVFLDRVEVAADTVSEVPCGLERFARRAALVRAVSMAGAAQAALALAVRHAREREQFGRPLARFQAVQHYLARIAAESSRMETATIAAVEALDNDEFGADAAIAVAAVKAVADRAAMEICTLAHQVLGALGTTREHALHRFTSRLESWRAEAGSAADHELEIGRLTTELLLGSPAALPAIPAAFLMTGPTDG